MLKTAFQKMNKVSYRKQIARQHVRACKRSQKFGGSCWDSAPLVRGRGWPLETRYSPRVFVKNFVAIGQTVWP